MSGVPGLSASPQSPQQQNATQRELEDTRPEELSDPFHDPMRDMEGEEAARQAAEEPGEPWKVALVRERVIRAIHDTIPSELTSFDRKFTLITTNFKSWGETMFHSLVEGHVVRKWTSWDGYITIDIQVTSLVLVLKQVWKDWFGGDATTDSLNHYVDLLDFGERRMRTLFDQGGATYLRMEIAPPGDAFSVKYHSKGAYQFAKLTGPCQDIRANGPIRRDHGWFELHPAQMGPRTGGPRGLTAPEPSRPGRQPVPRRPAGPITGQPRMPTAPFPYWWGI